MSTDQKSASTQAKRLAQLFGIDGVDINDLPVDEDNGTVTVPAWVLADLLDEYEEHSEVL